MFKKVLVPLDGSQLAEVALESARFIARASQGQLMLVRSAGLSAPKLTWDDPAPALDAQESECLSYLQAVQQSLEQPDLRVVVEYLEAGSPAQQLLELIEDEEIDLVVMTSHGRSGLSRVLLGSVAETVSRQARCPVMIIGRHSDACARHLERLEPVGEGLSR